MRLKTAIITAAVVLITATSVHAEPVPCIVATDSTAAPAEQIYFAERIPDGYWEPAGRHRITHYCPGRCCNGSNAGKTASGAPMTVGRTVAASKREFPFGTQLLINGQIYVVEDRGVGKGCIDILVDTHSEARKKGLYYTEVFVWRDYPITDGKVINDLRGGE